VTAFVGFIAGRIVRLLPALFKKVNDEGGINGRKINFITYDDSYSAPKAVEMVRKLVEQDQVLLVLEPLGTPSNTAIHKYMNQKKVPQLFVATGATKWGDPKNFPWTMGWPPGGERVRVRGSSPERCAPGRARQAPARCSPAARSASRERRRGRRSPPR